MSEFKLEKIKPATYILPKEGGMKVPGLVIATEELLEGTEIDQPLNQVKNVAHLPGIVEYSIAMPDIHWGYGFPIGGIAATDAKNGVISPGGVGYDINCGVRIAIIPEQFNSLSDKNRRKLLHQIGRSVPSGVGRGQKHMKGLNDEDYRKLIDQGAKWSVEKGFGFPEDLEHIESNGFIEGGNFDAVSKHAKERGRTQLGTIGSGNHFVEIGEVQKIFLPEIASAWGIEEGQIYVLIHSGSRGFGHQVCQDALNTFISKGYEKGLPDKQLVAAPINSPEGKKYFQAMAAAANYAFNNRQQILHEVRNSFQYALGTPPEQIKLIYDVCHNIAKFEEHRGQLLCVHRKGATRAYGPGAKELNPIYQKTGQPVLVPGDMGSASHLLVGLGNPITWSSSCHGAGRARSRVKSMKAWKNKNPVQYMEQQGVHVLGASFRTIAEEMPDAYKNVDQVVEAVQQAELANKVVRLRPYLVVKG